MSARSPLKVASVQFCGRVGMWQDNLRRMQPHITHAQRQHAKLILFPETSLTGYTSGRAHIQPTAQTIPGPGSDAIQKLAQKLGMAISVGISEKAGQRYFISQVTALPDGKRHVYRKRFGREAGYSRGEHVPPFMFEGYRFGPCICMDARIYELYRQYAYCNTDVILKPNSAWTGPWKEDRLDHFEEKKSAHDRMMLLDWRKDCLFAATNGMAILSANTVGDNGSGVFPGGCWFGDGSGVLKSHLKLEYEKARLKEKILFAHIDPHTLATARADVKYDLEMAKSYYS